MISLLLAFALLAALAASLWRLLRRRRFARALAALPGGARATALAIDAFSQIEDHLAHRECPCGGNLSTLGERSENVAGRILRVVRVECGRCEERSEVWFDATSAYQ
ncbi:MAG TPA: hypothetical protein VGK20_00470 [Candidatus Binatia bacterium]